MPQISSHSRRRPADQIVGVRIAVVGKFMARLQGPLQESRATPASVEVARQIPANHEEGGPNVEIGEEVEKARQTAFQDDAMLHLPRRFKPVNGVVAHVV